jgi:FAD binding domain in molybdopterin dehydrogenase
MNRFDYVRPATVSEAVAAAAVPGSAYLAAGTNLIDLMKGGIVRPKRLIDVSRLPGLDQIEPLPDGGVRHCQLKQRWYAPAVGGAVVRCGEVLGTPIGLSPSQPRGDRSSPRLR